MPLWTPANLAVPPHAWWDFSDPATMTFDESGVNVLTVANKTGVASRDLERIRTWVPGPEFSDTALPGGLPGLYIQQNGEAVSGLRTSLANDFGLNGSSFGVFLSCYVPYRSTSYFQPYFIGQPAGDYNESAPGFNRLFYYPRGDNPPEGAFEGEFGSGINFSSLSAFVGGYVSDTGYREYRVSGGTPKTTATSPAADWEKIGIPEAPRQDWSYPLDNSSWGEALVLGHTPTTDERQKIEGWMAWKHGCQSTLPADHPYKTAPPQTEAEGITGDASATLASLSGNAAGRLAISGTTTRTLAGVARSSTSRIRVRANAARTLAGVAGSAAGAARITANASQQLQALTGSATGESQALTPITGNAAALLSDLTGSATATTGPVIPDEQPSAGGWGARPLNSRTRRAIRRGIERELERQKSEQDELASAYDRAQGIVEAALEAADIPVPATVAAPDLYEATRQVVAMAEAAELGMQMVARQLLVRIDAYLLELKSQRDAEEMAIALLLVA